MEITSDNANSIARNLGRTLITSGYKMLASSYNVVSKQVNFNSIQDLITSKIGCEFGPMDNNFFLTDIATWKNIIASDWLFSTKKYILDKFDCDNYSFCFASHVSELFDLSVFVCYTDILNTNTQARDRHYFNVIITQEADLSLHLWCFDQLNGNNLWEITNKGQIHMVNWDYNPIKITEF